MYMVVRTGGYDRHAGGKSGHHFSEPFRVRGQIHHLFRSRFGLLLVPHRSARVPVYMPRRGQPALRSWLKIEIPFNGMSPMAHIQKLELCSQQL